MNCYSHPELSAVIQCADCSKGLCKTCAENYTIPICTSCNNIRKANEKKGIYKEIFTTIGVGIILSYFMLKMDRNASNMSIMHIILTVYTSIGIVSGWKITDKILPKYYFSISTFYFGYLGSAEKLKRPLFFYPFCFHTKSN